MRISFNQTTGPNVRDNNGYGYAAKMCKESLTTLGHEITWRDQTADIEMNFIQPDNWYWSGVDYRIGYLPWESDQFHPGWIDKINNVDEIWTPSPVIAQWMVDAGVNKEPRVYQHGVDACWANQKRPTEGTFHLLHHGAEAIRKGGQETIDAFIDKLWDADAVLTLKMQLLQANYIDSDHIWIRKDKIPLDELVQLYHDNHLLVYPSWGEGFGLAPIQAMATGMPVIITKGWAPYQHLLPESSLLDSQLVESPWQGHHPGRMFKPNLTILRDMMVWHYENREEATRVAYETAVKVHEQYNWLDLTEKAFSHLTSSQKLLETSAL